MVRTVARGGKFYWLPPDKENTGCICEGTLDTVTFTEAQHPNSVSNEDEIVGHIHSGQQH